MKERILQLCKRLNKFTIDEIETISEINSKELLPILKELVSNNKLIKSNGVYVYNKQSKYLAMAKLPHFFNYHSKEKIGLIMKCFCAEIPIMKTALILDLCNDTIAKFYTYFREILYSTQYSELEKYYYEQPKIPSMRALYDKKICLYTYNNKIFISEKPIKTNKILIRHTKEELRNSNMAYYKIRRVFQNYAFTQSVAEIANEKLWMQDKTQEQKLNYLKDLLNISSFE